MWQVVRVQPPILQARLAPACMHAPLLQLCLGPVREHGDQPERHVVGGGHMGVGPCALALGDDEVRPKPKDTIPESSEEPGAQRPVQSG